MESFDSLTPTWMELCYRASSDYPFVLPIWLEVWWREFGKEAHQYLCAVKQGETVIGIAPLLLRENRASFIGSPDTCDYLDFVIILGRERDFFNALLANLAKANIASLELLPLRPNSTVLTSLVKVAPELGFKVSCQLEDVSLELDLPPVWDEYLGLLNVKQRHEMGRKLRRLREAGDIDYHVVEDEEAIQEYIDLFLHLFRESRQNKAIFMTAQMESFFRSMAEAMAEAKILRLGILKLNTSPVAAVMCFDYRGTVYLYNSGYDPRYSSLSVGMLSKVLFIQDSIRRGRKRFDFLKGSEEYKYHLGGREIPLYNCQIALR